MPRWGGRKYATVYQGRCPWLGCVTPSGYARAILPDSNIYFSMSECHTAAGSSKPRAASSKPSCRQYQPRCTAFGLLIFPFPSVPNALCFQEEPS